MEAESFPSSPEPSQPRRPQVPISKPKSSRKKVSTADASAITAAMKDNTIVWQATKLRNPFLKKHFKIAVIGEEIMHPYHVCQVAGCANPLFFVSSGSSNLKSHLKQKHELLEKFAAPNQPSMKQTFAAKKLKVPKRMKETMTSVLAEWCTMDGRPFSFVEDEGMRKVATILMNFGAELGQKIDQTQVEDDILPCPSTVTIEMENQYVSEAKKLKARFVEFLKDPAAAIAITFDLFHGMSLYLHFHLKKRFCVCFCKYFVFANILFLQLFLCC